MELLITTAIFAVASLAVYATFNSGIRVWRRAQDISSGQSKVLLKAEKMARELRQAFYYKDIPFAGSKDMVSFAQAQDSGMFRVTYSFDGTSNKMFRAQTGLSSIITEEREPRQSETKAALFLADVDGIKFSFYAYNSETKTYIWKDGWTEEDNGKIPLGIKMELTVKGQVYRGEIFIPAASGEYEQS
jgi:hypothetical protein